MSQAPNGFDLEMPVILAPQLMRAVQIVQQAGYVVVARSRLKIVEITGKVQEPPETATAEQAAGHFSAVARQMSAQLGVRIVEMKLAQAASSPDADPAFKGYALRALLIGPTQASAGPKIIKPN